MVWFVSAQEPVLGSSESGNEFLGFMKYRECSGECQVSPYP